MDDVTPPPPADTTITNPPAVAKSPVAALRTLVADFQMRMVCAQTKEFAKIKKSLSKLFVVPITVRIGSDGSFILESFEIPDIFFALGRYDEEDMAKYEHVFGKGRTPEQIRANLDAAFEAHNCMQMIGYFAANKMTEVRIF